ncbi:MAG: PAS domain S-box protein [Candidatus Methanoperedens sp.]|nr:PAS domain S-box protein [Candidatus Methanoperedens sp.]
MKLRNKTLGFIIFILICMIFIQYEVSQLILMENINKMEDEYVLNNIETVTNTLQNDINKLDNIVNDWATWDETYSFVDQLNDNYKRMNLIDVTFTNLNINLMLFINSQGRIVYGKAFDDNGEEIPVPLMLTGLSVNDPLMAHNDKESFISGIIMLPDGPMLITSHPILTRKSEGPIRGTLIMGRFLDRVEIERLSGITNLSLSMYSFDDPAMSSDFSEAGLSLLKNKTFYIKPSTEETITGYKVLNDIYGNPALILGVVSTREFYRQGQVTMWYFFKSIIAIGIIFGIVTLFFLEKSVLSPLSDLSTNLSRIENSGDLSERIVVRKKENDELGNLADDINRMLGSLEQSTEKMLRSEEKTTAFINAIPDVMLQLSKDGKILKIKANEQNFLGLSLEELKGKKIFEAMPPDLASKTSVCIDKALATGEIQILEFNSMEDEKQHDYEARYISSGKDEILAIIRDITERKQAEEAQKNELLLKEVHHRIKNNLQVISSLLYLQSRNINDEAIVEMFKESQARVKSVAIAHEKLYKSGEMGKIDVRDYIRDITGSLFQSYGSYSNSAKLSLDVDKVLLDIDIAIPCGLIINELVTNSLKYAFSGGMEGNILVEFHRVNNKYELVVADNGKGLPEDFDIRKTETLGLKLITTLSSQIGGIIDIDRIGGTKFTITFEGEKI